MASAVIETLAFSEAKAKLSELMSDVVHRHGLRVVDRHHGKEEMVLVSREDVLAMLERFEFEPQVSVSEGEFVIRLPELGLVASGESLEESQAELVELAEDYAEQFFSRLSFFMETDRRTQLPWVARLALTAPERRRDLFVRSAEREQALQTA
jgi:Antitoxin of toxin-antitoxin, RelE / RelB, TA system